MNSGDIKASDPGSEIIVIAQLLVAMASSGQTASGTTSLNRQVTALDKPYHPATRSKQGEEKSCTQDLSGKRCTLTTPENQVAGRQGQQSSGPGQASQCYNVYPQNVYPQAGFDGQHLQADELPYQQSGRTGLSLKERKVYQCDFDGCGKKYTRIYSLKRHILIHAGQREDTYKCYLSNCGKRFAQECDLKKHLHIHTEHKPFKCYLSKCDKRFCQKIDLIRHERTHTGEKPFECEAVGCGKRFNRKHALERHQLVIHLKKHSNQCKPES